MSISVNPSKTILTHIRKDGSRRDIPITCLIRDHRVKPDAHPMDSKGKLYPQFYQPMHFPVGEWKLTGIRPKKDPYMAPFFFSTDAHQLVECLDGTVVEDWGYGAHHSTSRTTWGCLNILSEADAVWLAGVARVEEDFIVL